MPSPLSSGLEDAAGGFASRLFPSFGKQGPCLGFTGLGFKGMHGRPHTGFDAIRVQGLGCQFCTTPGATLQTL